MSDRNHYIDALKGYAILLVVLGHAVQRTAAFGYWPAADASPYLPFSGYVTMPLFFAVSGYLTFGRVRKPVHTWMGAKARALLIPFVSWTLLYYVAVRDKFIPTDLPLFDYARSQLISPSLWYFVILFLCYVIVALGFGFGDWTLPLLGLALLLVPIPWLGSLKWYWWWFLGGYFIARFKTRVLPLRWLAWATAVPTYLAGVALLGQNTGVASRCAMGLSAALAGTFVVWLLCKAPALEASLAHLGIHSLEVYAGQFLFVQLLVVRAPMNVAIITTLAIAGSLALGWLLSKNTWTDAIFLGARRLPGATPRHRTR